MEWLMILIPKVNKDQFINLIIGIINEFFLTVFKFFNKILIQLYVRDLSKLFQYSSFFEN